MAILSEHPYGGFNFLVSLEGLDAEGPAAGFSRVSGLDRSVAMIPYRAGNAKTRRSTLIPGLVHPPRVVLERGSIGSLALHEWLATAASGRAERRTVIIELLDEAREPVQRWRLLNALPTAIRTSALDAQHSEVVVESLTLVAEDLDVE
jgi:phage tail-like protein